MHAHEIVILCGILVAGFFCQWVAWRLKLPAILFLLISGILVGPVFNWLDPDVLLGDLMMPLVSIAVAIILFEGSLTLKLSELKGHGGVVRNLVTVGVLITWICSALLAYYLFDWDVYLSALFGAIVTVSGPTVVMPLLRSVRPTKSVSNILKWEAILIDPFGAILALLIFDLIIATQSSDGIFQALTAVIVIVFTGGVLGALGGYLFGLAIRQRLIPDFLRDYAALACALMIFALAELVHGESGLLAVTIMGVWLANMRSIDIEDILSFKESLTLLLVAGLFIILSARVDLDALLNIGAGAFILILVLQFVVGPLRAVVCTIGSQMTWPERLFLGWVFPRGIVAAAISALFALRLEESGYAEAGSLVPLVFTVILGTVIIQSLSARSVASWLGVAEPNPNGILIVGANPAALVIAKAIHDSGRSVMISDSHWASINDARMLGLPTYYGSAVSSYADHKLDLSGIGVLLSMSRRPGLNELACVRFAEDFGRDNVYTLSNQSEKGHDKHKVSGETRGRVIFGGELMLDDLLKRVADGDTIKTTELSEAFDYSAYQQQHPNALLLFTTDKNNRIHFPVDDQKLTPESGWTITALMPPSEITSSQNKHA